jgi:hypothetical protein
MIVRMEFAVGYFPTDDGIGPHPPILVGGEGPTVLDRVRAYGTAWFHNYNGTEAMAERIVEAAKSVEVQVCGAPADAATLERFRAAGVTRVVRWLPSGPRSQVEKALDRWEQAIAELVGA